MHACRSNDSLCFRKGLFMYGGASVLCLVVLACGLRLE